MGAGLTEGVVPGVLIADETTRDFQLLRVSKHLQEVIKVRARRRRSAAPRSSSGRSVRRRRPLS
eukprot:COSAG01_NODE_9425_length_2455_cov_14.507234_3_plen_64_part_00